MLVHCEFWVTQLGIALTLADRLGEPSEECTQPIFVGDLAYEDALKFVFQCRAEEWLQAEGYIRKRRRQGGDPGPVEDPRVEPFPKPEPVEEAIHVNEIVMDGLEAIPAAGSPPRSRPPIYADEGPVAQPRETTHSALRPTGQEETRAEPDFITLERPRKIAKRSGNSMFTISDENASTVIGVHSVHQHSVEESGSRPMVKLEEKVKVEVKMEEGGAIPKVKEELEVCYSGLDAIPPVNFYPRLQKKSWRNKFPSSYRRETPFGGKWPPCGPQRSKVRSDLGPRSRPRESAGTPSSPEVIIGLGYQ